MKKVSILLGTAALSAMLLSCSTKIEESSFVSVRGKTSSHFYLKSADFIHSLSFRSDGKVKVNEMEKVSRLENYSYDENSHIVTLNNESLSLYRDEKNGNLYCKIAEGKPGALVGNVFNMTVESDGSIETIEVASQKTLKISAKLSEPDKVNYSYKKHSKNVITFCWNGNAYELLFNEKTGELYTEVGHCVKSQLSKGKHKFAKKTSTAPSGFVRVQGGVFLMGSENGESVEKPVHQVTLNSFFMSKTEITQQQYFDVMNKKPSKLANSNSYDCPVENVSWYDAIYYCNQRSVSEGRTPCYSVDGIAYCDFWDYEPNKGGKITGKITCDYTQDGYRLPTEAEWEYAARGGNNSEQTVFAGSDDISAVAWYEGNSRKTTHDVASLNPNQLVIFDMSGNVGEWCYDWFNDYSEKASTNPEGSETGSAKVIRGSSYENGAYNCTVSYRDYEKPENISSKIGFRVVCGANE